LQDISLHSGMLKGKLFFYSLCLVALLIPFDLTITKLFITIAFFLWISSSWKCVKFEWPLYGKFFLLFASLYLINFPGLILTEDMEAGFLRLESRLSYLVFPLLILFSNLDRAQLRAICYSFIAGITICSLICLSSALYVVYQTEPALRAFEQITYLDLLDVLDLHPSFICVFVSFAIFFLFYDLSTHAVTTVQRTLLITLTAYLCIFNFLLQSRAPLAAFVFIVVAFVLVLILRSRANFKLLLTSGIVLLLVVTAVAVNTKSIASRFELSFGKLPEIVMKPDSLLSNESMPTQSTIYHLRSWYCATHLLSDYHFFTGHGSGDEKDVLQPCYESHGWLIMAGERQNAHNEYFSALLRAGILELLLLLGCLFIPAVIAFRQRSYLYVAFLLMWMATFVFNTLNLQSALFFFAMFNAILCRMMMQDRVATVAQSENKLK
jgi:O-antigen ligase